MPVRCGDDGVVRGGILAGALTGGTAAATGKPPDEDDRDAAGGTTEEEEEEEDREGMSGTGPEPALAERFGDVTCDEDDAFCTLRGEVVARMPSPTPDPFALG